MKKAVLIILVFALLLGCVNITATAVSVSDISGHWAQTYIQKMVDLGIMDTKNDMQFKPNELFSRKEAAKSGCMLFKENNLPSTPHPFTDVSGEYAPYIKWMYDAGVVSGTTSTTFSPDSYIKRQDLCVILYNLYFSRLGIPFISQRASVAYSDDSSISSYAKTKVYALQQIYVVTVGGAFRPKEYVTRAEAATMLFNLWSYAMILSTPQQQQLPNTCWAACAKVMAEYRYPGSRTQQDIINYITNGQQVGASLRQAAVGAKYATYNNIDHAYSPYRWTSEQLIAELSHYRPVTIAINQQDGTEANGDPIWENGHDIVVIGYITNRADSYYCKFFIYDVSNNRYYWLDKAELDTGWDTISYLDGRKHRAQMYSIKREELS